MRIEFSKARWKEQSFPSGAGCPHFWQLPPLVSERCCFSYFPLGFPLGTEPFFWRFFFFEDRGGRPRGLAEVRSRMCESSVLPSSGVLSVLRFTGARVSKKAFVSSAHPLVESGC